jgi:hypothetical protein
MPDKKWKDQLNVGFHVHSWSTGTVLETKQETSVLTDAC